MGTDTTRKALFDTYRNNQMTDNELELLDHLLVGGLAYRRDKRAWQNLLADNGIARPAENAIALPRPFWQRLTVVRPMILRIAATVLLVVGASWWFFQDNAPRQNGMDLLEKNLQDITLPTPQARMGSTTTVDEKWESARNAFMDKNYSAAIAQLESLAPRTVEQTFFLAASYMQRASAGDFAQAAVHFQIVLTRKTGNFEKEARWYLALCDLKLGNKDAARPLLEAIKNAQGWKADDAAALLKTF